MTTIIFLAIIIGIISYFAFKPKPSKPKSKTQTPNSPLERKATATTPSITIEYGTKGYSPQANSRASKAPISWKGGGEAILVGKYIISEPLTYYCHNNQVSAEASCIVNGLRVNAPVSEPKGTIGYWSSYSKISPAQRANYLTWLQGGRKDPLEDIGYAFIFFYGLERRAIVERADIDIILNETLRLLDTYTFSGSFDGYLSRFITFVIAREGLENLSAERLSYLDKAVSKRSEDALALKLALLYQQATPLPPEMAFELARMDVRSPRSVVVDRVADEFKALFNKKYAARFGSGLKLKTGTGKREISYHPASPTLLAMDYAARSAGIVIPNILGIQSQFKPLVEIWTECIEELRSFSRQTAKAPEKLTREAYRALPDMLKAETEHPDKPKWEGVIAAKADDKGRSIVSVGALAEINGIEKRAKLTAKQSEGLSITSNEVGFIMVPDYRLIKRPYLWEENVSMVSSRGESAAIPTGNSLAGALVMLEMGVAMAAADGTVEESEIKHIANILEGTFMLDPIEVLQLEAFRDLLLGNPPNLAKVCKRLKATLDSKQRESLGRFLVGVAASNGIIDDNEIKALKEFYKIMELDFASCQKLLRDISGVENEDAPVVVSVGVESAKGEVIPRRDASTLNTELIGRIMSETAKVARMLEEAMPDEDEEVAPKQLAQEDKSLRKPVASANPDPTGNDSVPPNGYIGLDTRFHRALDEILVLAGLDKSTFNELARRHGLMPNSLFEEINTWSDEIYGDFLIADDYSVNHSLLEGVKWN